MKTDDLINALAADATSVEPPITWTLAVAVAIGGLVSLVASCGTGCSPRFFMHSCMDSGRFLFKFVLTLSVAIPAFFCFAACLVRTSCPEGDYGGWPWHQHCCWRRWRFELFSVPADAWHARMIGHNSLNCLT